MFGSELLEVAIGIIFLFFVLSLLLSAAREVIEGWLQTRAIHLERGIREMLKDEDGTGLTSKMYAHPLVSSLFRGEYSPDRLTPRIRRWGDEWRRMRFGTNLPAYIPARNFAGALLDIAARGLPTDVVEDVELTLERARNGLADQIENATVRRGVLLAIEQAKGDLDQARANLEAWFDSGMDRVSGWYRKETQTILIVLGFLTAFALNIDSLRVAKALYENDSLRTVIVSDAEAVVEAARAEGTDPADTAAMLRLLGCADPAAGTPAASPPSPSGATPAAQGAAAPTAAPATTPTSAATAGGTGNTTSPTAVEAQPRTDAAQTRASAPTPVGNVDTVSCAERRIRNLGLPIGWQGKRPADPGSFKTWGAYFGSFPWGSLPGWLLTALAVSMGAPFWFDLLNKAMVIRSTVKPHEKSQEEASEDRQFPRDRVVQAAPSTLSRQQTTTGGSPQAATGASRVDEVTPERFPDGVNRQEADDLEDEARASVAKLDPEEEPDAR